MHWNTLPLSDQIFTHIDPSTKVETVLAATRLRALADASAVFASTPGEPTNGRILKILTDITSEGAKICVLHRGIEEPRLRNAMKTVASKKITPLLYTEWGDGTHLLIDGSHTYVALYLENYKAAPSYMVPETIWRSYCVEGLPKERSEADLLASYSGVGLAGPDALRPKGQRITIGALKEPPK
jgi:hypothetical protein